MGKPAATARPCLRSLSHSFTLDWVVLCSGTKEQARALKEELHIFLKGLGLELSLEKTKVTHITDGFKFLGFWMERSRSGKGKMVPKIKIPQEALRKFREKIAATLASHNDSFTTKIMALNAITRGWCQYYQHTSSPQQVFGMLEHERWWQVAHWLGRKYQISIPLVCRRFRQKESFGTKKSHLIMPRAFKTKRYKRRIPVNPYTAEAENLTRDDLFDWDRAWIGNEHRKGWRDMRDLVLERDEHVCTQCGKRLNEYEVEVDHKNPRTGHKRPTDAEYLENLQILCTACHRAKSKSDRQVLSRVR